MAPTIAQVCDGIMVCLSTATGLQVSRSYSTLREAVNDDATLEVYWESEETNLGGADRASFGATTRISELVYHADLYAKERMDVGEDNEAIVTLAEAIRDRLKSNEVGLLFGTAGVISFHWHSQRVTFQRNDGIYPGVRFVITVRAA